MEGSKKMTAGLIIFIGLIIWCLAPVFAQTMTFNFHPDGTMTKEHDSRQGYSFERYDSEMRLLEVSHYFPGGVRMKMFDKYTYTNDMLVERVAYLYTQGYERTTYQYNEYGYETESRHYSSKTEGNWVQDHYMIQGYDERNNRNYFRVKGTFYGDVNSMARTTYDYSAMARSVVEYTFDANDREISSRSYKGGIGKWQLERAGKFVFDVKKHGENMRPNRVLKWLDRDQNGNSIEQFFINHNTLTRTIDRNGRVIKIQIGDQGTDDDGNLVYDYDEVIDFKYDQQGRLMETQSKHYSDAREKRTYRHGRTVEEKHFRQNANGTWKAVGTRKVTNIDLLTPHQPSRINRPIASSVQQGENGASHVPNQTINQNHSVTANEPRAKSDLLDDLNGLKIESNQSESLNAFSMDAEKLSHIADVLSHASGTRVSEEQVLALAMQILIESYNADLREMNNAYLKDKVSVFD